MDVDVAGGKENRLEGRAWIEGQQMGKRGGGGGTAGPGDGGTH